MMLLIKIMAMEPLKLEYIKNKKPCNYYKAFLINIIFDYLITPSSFPTFSKAAKALSKCALV
jgi:hypothetical protein